MKELEGSAMQREKNVGPVERGARIIGGGIAAISGLLWLLGGPASAFVAVAAVVLIALGLDFFVTGVTGYCPLYQRLGWSTAPHRHAPLPRR